MPLDQFANECQINPQACADDPNRVGIMNEGIENKWENLIANTLSGIGKGQGDVLGTGTDN